MRRLAAVLVALVFSTSAQAELIGVSRYTRLDAAGSAGTINDSRFVEENTFADFDQTIHAGAAASGATSSSTSTQKSSVGNGAGGWSASGGASSGFTGSGSASSSSLFRYQFQSDTTDLYRFIGAIGRSGDGHVLAYLRDLASPPDVFLLEREVSLANNDTGETWIENFQLIGGHTYEVLVDADSGPQQAATSYNLTFSAIPEPGTITVLLAAAPLLLRRRPKRL
jgi:hypothetical protein